MWKAAIPDSPLKITPLFTHSELTGFSVVDEKGITYLFGGQYIEKGIPTRYPTGWMLYQIILPGATPNQINITWEKYMAACNAEHIYYEYCVLREQYYELMENPGVEGPTFMDFQGMPYPDYDVQTVFIPKQFSMPNQTMDFTYVAYGERPYITGFTVKNKLNQVVKSIGMDYINPATYTNYTTLTSLYVSGEGTFNFDYYGGEYMSPRAQDLWGYYNGILSNATLVPSFRIQVAAKQIRLYTFEGANRSTDATAMQNFMLKKVTYPTGGYMGIEYEPHQFEPRLVSDILINGSYSSYLAEGGGVRVKRTISSPEHGAPEVIRTYKYGTNESGKGTIVDPPELRWFINDQFFYHRLGCIGDPSFGSFGCYHFDLAFSQKVIGSTPANIACPTYNPNVWYPEVTEYEGDNKSINYYQCLINTSYILSQPLTGGEGAYGGYPPFYIQNYINLAQRGALLNKKITFKKEGLNYIPVEKAEYHYNAYGGLECSNVQNTLSARLYSDDYGKDLVVSHRYAIPQAFYVGNYWINLVKWKVDREKKTMYYGSDSLVTEKSVDTRFHDERVYLPYVTTVTDSEGDVYSDYVYYPYDTEITTLMNTTQRVALSSLKTENRIATPLVHVRKKGSMELYKKVMQYNDFGNKLLLPEKEYYRKGGGVEEARISYLRYDGRGNPQEAIQDNSIKIVYLWGYNSLYPVARIEGATYAEVEGWLGAATISSLASSNAPESLLSSIRNTLIVLPLTDRGIQLTTYTYKPLVGIASITAPTGEKTTYEYDSSGRITMIKDHNGKTVEQYEYQLINE